MSIEVKGVKYKGEFNDVQYDNPTFDSDFDGLHKRPSKENGQSEESYNYPPVKDGLDPTEVVVDDDSTRGKWSPNEPDRKESPQKEHNACIRVIGRITDFFSDFYQKNKRIIIITILVVLLLLYFAYFGYAMYYERLSNENSRRLCWVTCLVVLGLIIHFVWTFAGEKIKKACKPCTDGIHKHQSIISWVAVTILFTFVVIFVLVDVFTISKQPYNLVSAVGIIVYVLLFFIFSYSPAHVQWRAVAWGLGLQFLFAIIILRWDAGYSAFEWLGKQISTFLAYSDVGAAFVFGDEYYRHFFAFSVLSTVVFFSTAISVLFYLGVMQAVIGRLASVMEFFMGTTAGESLNAAGNIFVGQTEAPLMIRPLLPHMTRSEIHAVMTGGFATIAGGVLAAYIKFGVPPNHLLSASVMSAPAALAMSKLFYPETEVSKTTAKDVAKMEPSKERNIIEAASAGASTSVGLVANIAANLIAFMAILAFVNATLMWFGQRVGVENLSFEFICSYVLFPFAWIMGVEPADCRRVAEWIGTKTFLNEFIAYDAFGKAINHTDVWTQHVNANGTWQEGPGDYGITLHNYYNPQFNATYPEAVLEHGIVSARTIAITTYALCGFSNFGSIGIQLGALGAMCPERKGDLARVALRAMIAGNVACFMTACIAGLFFREQIV